MIWCVEDDASIRDIELYALTSTGFEARGFADGDTFWDALQRETPPELVVLDVMLPGTDGIELLRQKLRRGVKNGGNAGGVLCGQGGNGAHGKHAVGGHGLDIGLNSGAAAGITAGNGQCSFHR